MAGMCKNVVRLGVIGALGAGALVVVAGPQRVGALFHQVRDSVNEKIDGQITDPVALRSQLRDLEATYPKRIAQVRSDLSEVRDQIAQLDREHTINQRVVALADNDLSTMQTLLTRAEDARVQTVALSSPKRVEVLFQDERLSVDGAYKKAAQITATRNAYASRAADVERDLGYLNKQHERLTALLTKLEGEQADFQAQLWQLDRQVDSIARNERMIDILSKREKSIDEQSRYRAASLDQLNAKLADLRSKQEAQLATIASAEERTSYEDRARIELDRHTAPALYLPAPKAPDTGVIEITPHDAADECEDDDSPASGIAQKF